MYLYQQLAIIAAASDTQKNPTPHLCLLSKDTVFHHQVIIFISYFQLYTQLIQIYIYIYHFLETAQTNDCETFESKTWALARQCFHFQNGLNPSFMPTQQRPSRALTESLADQFHLIRQLTFQKLVLAQFLFARYFLRLAREVVPIYIIKYRLM
ncbi:Hypothetical_protein [Hexamita inflata]|uniref:Hypothetical_protein n=1 Tax=Hexamita inflata TaxID=28002 RepID=A0AA86TGZ4_9EUKA|nr:Hypothetical protein HINF_LOCUS4920 [Hexamita inflata]